METNKRSLLLRYSIHQVLFWMAYCGITSFAVTYLTGRGFSAAMSGAMMFSGNVVSFILQMPLADYADRHASKNSLPFLMTLLAAVSLISIFLIRTAVLSAPVFFILFTLTTACFDMEIPLMNSTCVFYASKGYRISYGIPRAAAAIMFGAASLFIGFAMSDWGIEWMPNITIIGFVLFIIVSITYPRVDGADTPAAENKEQDDSLDLAAFFRQYKWYTLSLLSIVLFGLVHISAENYFIEIFKAVGGDSSNVGVALCIGTVLEAPVAVIGMWAMRKAGAKRIWLLVGISFAVRMSILLCARSVMTVYLSQIIQLTSYGLIPPGQVYYSDRCVSEADMVKGQSISTAAYVLGCALGNLMGGILVDGFGVRFMLAVNIGFSVISVIVAAICVPKALAERKEVSDDKLRN